MSTDKDPSIRLKLTHMGLHFTFDGGEGVGIRVGNPWT